MKNVSQVNVGAGAVQLGCVHGTVIILQCAYVGTCGGPTPHRLHTTDAQAANDRLFQSRGGPTMPVTCTKSGFIDLARNTLLLLVAATALTAPAWAINKCTGSDGKVTFQDAPCVSSKSETLDFDEDGRRLQAVRRSPA